MFLRSHTMLRNPCLIAGSGPAMQTSVRLPTGGAAPQSRRWDLSPRFPVGLVAAPYLRAGSRPTLPGSRDSRHRPRSSSAASVGRLDTSALPLRRRGPARSPDARGLPASGRAYPPANAAFYRLFSFPRRSPVAPFFRRLHALTVQNGRTRLPMPPFGLAQLLMQSRVDPLPGALSPPVAEVGIDRSPGRKLMRQHPPLATAPQHVQDRIHNLSPSVFGGAASGFDRRHKGFQHFPFRVAQVSRVTPPCGHAAILPAF